MRIEPVIYWLLVIAAAVWFLTAPRRRRARQRRLAEPPFPPAWRQILRRRMPYYQRMPFDLQRQLQKRMQVFLADKRFVGCQGLEITEEMRVLIAAQACLLILNRPTDYFPHMSEILVYPDAFVVERDEADEAGVVHRVRQTVAGESWADSQVVLSWPDVLAGAARTDDAYNVVIHEFAHQLDHESGASNGAPVMRSREQAELWARAFDRAYQTLLNQLDEGEGSFVDAYGADSPVEFFAVVTEAFFERPLQLKRDDPALYDALMRFYCVDPTAW